MRPVAGTLADIGRWASADPGVETRLREGARVAVVGCGRGEIVIGLAMVFPESVVAGFDHREREIAIARMAAAASGVNDRVTFEVSEPADVRGADYDVVWWTPGRGGSRCSATDSTT